MLLISHKDDSKFLVLVLLFCTHCVGWLVSFPDPPPPFRQFYLDRGAEEGSGNIAIPFLYRGGGVTDE